jgi:hypothetical protein
MNRTIFLMTVALPIATALPTPAVADFYIQRADGSYFVIPEVLVLAVALAFLLGVIFKISDAVTSASSGDDLPVELSTPETADYYDDQAARARALKRQLDAETELAESYINAKRTKAQLDEIEEILGHDKAKRRGWRGG